MWESYHKLRCSSARCSSAFKLLWSDFLVYVGCEAEPIFFQHLTDTMMDMLIRTEFSLTIHEGLDLEEKYALRYAALKKK